MGAKVDASFFCKGIFGEDRWCSVFVRIELRVFWCGLLRDVTWYLLACAN